MAALPKPLDNIPMEVGPLSYDTPKEYPPDDQFGRSWGYGTPAGTFYCDDKCHERIQAAGIRKGQTFTVIKGKEADGRTNKWTINGGAGATTSPNGQPNQAQPAPRAASGLTFADVSFGYRECLFAASGHLAELAGLQVPADGQPHNIPVVPFEVIQSAAATLMIQADRSGCLPRAPKAKPNIDGEHTKKFLGWLAEYRVREDIAALWPGGKPQWTTFIQKVADNMPIEAVMSSNDPVMYDTIKTLILAETSVRAEAAKDQPQEEGGAEIPF